MHKLWHVVVLVAAACAGWLVDASGFAQSADVLPAGVQAVWDLRQAQADTTPTRERVCINGLWQWQPAEATSDRVPDGNWGYFKVPGPWPGVTDYMQKDFQTVHPHPSWQTQKLAGISAAWYQRQIAIPAGWTGRRITLAAGYLNSFAAVYLDGKPVGEIRFPAGEAELTAHCQPGAKQMLSMLVVAMPLKGVRLSFNDSNAARQVQGSVARRGLCGDVYLVATPAAARLTDIAVTTSVRNRQIAVAAALENLTSDDSYTVRAEVREQGRIVQEFASPPFRAADVRAGRIEFSAAWLPDRLWDTHTPQHQYELGVSLLDRDDQLLDAAHPVRFGFRELWIEGRDFYLNGSRIYLSAVPLDNAQVGAAAATYAGARESLERLQSFGINFVYTHNYSCQPGAHLSFAEILRAADDVGMLVALSQPHFSDYDWQAADAEQTNGYAEHAAWYVRVAQPHPSVVMYATSHNATGYSEDMNPDLIDGRYDQRSSWAMNNVRRAVRAEAIIRQLDPSRIVYHHSSGNLGSMHTSNFYPNFVPIQEMSDWFEHWATVGVKPFFACEYGAPFTWDWALYRGWYKGGREFGSAVVPWDFSLAEWNAQFLGSAAYRISDQERRNIRWEAERFRSGRLWHRWDYPHQLGSSDFDERYPILAKYYTDNWRAFRTWGVSAISPWEHHVLFKLRPGLDRNRRVELPTAWEKLQRPGFSPDYLEERYERMDLAYERSDWTATPAAAAMYRNNSPLLAYLGGSAARFTSQDHNFLPGETVDKQLIAINNARVPVTCEYTWSLALPQPIQGAGQAVIETGQQARVPLRAVLPGDLPPGTYELSMQSYFRSVAGSDLAIDETQRDQFSIHVLPPIREAREAGNAAGPAALGAKIALFDPQGHTSRRLTDLGVHYDAVAAAADLNNYELLIIGRAALTADGPAPDLGRVPEGLKVLVFEQTSQALERRLGFRVQEYGLRNVWPRVFAHPVLDGLDAPHWRDWRGEATLLPPRLTYEPSDRYNGAPTVRWCGLEVPRLWRCGNRGNVASVLIEKPARGDFLPILEGGFGLQYSPLLEYRQGRGLVLFCQLDVTGRTEDEPAADRVVRNLLRYLAAWQPGPSREALYVGEPAGRAWFESAGLALASYDGGELRADQVLVVAPGGGAALAPHAAQLADWLKAGGHLLALELDAEEANQFLPSPMRTERRLHVDAWFDTPDARSRLAGVGPADVHNRAPRELPLVTGGAHPVGNGVLACGEHAGVVFCQQAPYRISRAQGRSPELTIDQQDAWDGQHSALLTLGTAPWAQFGQKVPGGEAGKTYTLAVFAKSLGEPVPLRLEVERAASPWDRVVRGSETEVGAEQWSEVHVTFAVDKPYPEGWQAYLHCGQEGGRLRVDRFRLYEGPYVPGRPGTVGSQQATPENLLANGSFEAGTEPWFFTWPTEQQNVRRTYRRATFTVLRLLANLGVRGDTPLLSRFAIPASGRGGESIVRNGDFQRLAEGSRLPADWQFTSDVPQASCTLEPAAPDGGSKCLQISWPEAAARDRGSVMLAQQEVPVEAGQWYRIVLHARAAGLGPDGVTLALQNTTNWRSLFEYQRFVPGDDWQEFRFLVQANATATSRTRFQIWYGQPGTLWLADVRMEPCDPPTQGRWLDGLYADQPQDWDDPYRFFRW
jgi:beta-galactosidase